MRVVVWKVMVCSGRRHHTWLNISELWQVINYLPQKLCCCPHAQLPQCRVYPSQCKIINFVGVTLHRLTPDHCSSHIDAYSFHHFRCNYSNSKVRLQYYYVQSAEMRTNRECGGGWRRQKRGLGCYQELSHTGSLCSCPRGLHDRKAEVLRDGICQTAPLPFWTHDKTHMLEGTGAEWPSIWWCLVTPEHSFPSSSSTTRIQALSS